MSLSLLVRPLALSETNIVLKAWKSLLYESRFRERWGRGLEGDCFWALVNHVIDKITLPSSVILVGCTKTEPGTPLTWIVLRKLAGLSTFEVLYVDARHEIRKDPKLSAALERDLLSEVTKQHALSPERVPFDPFRELRR